MSMIDEDALKTIRRAATKRWRNKATKKPLKNAVKAAEPPNKVQNGPKPAKPAELSVKGLSRRDVACPPAVKQI